LTPDGRVFFADDAYRTPDELVEGPASSIICRRLLDGTTASRSDGGQQEGVVRRLRDGRTPHGPGKVRRTTRGERLR
jgi:hypothetical protein